MGGEASEDRGSEDGEVWGRVDGGPLLGQAVGGRGEADLCLSLARREALLAEMGVAVREDGGTVGVFSPKKVCERLCTEA